MSAKLTRGGRTLRHREQVNRGNGERPLTETAISDKFHLNATRAVSAERARRIERMLLSLDDVADVRVLADGLAQG